jgi:transposase
MIHYVGLDCHRKSVRFCVREANRRILSEGDFPATRKDLEAFAAAHLTKEDVVALESTFHSRAIAAVLAPFVRRVVVSNPLQTKLIAMAKKKTDKVDARVLSDLLRAGYLPEVWLPDANTRELRDLCARRAALIGDRTRLKNRVHSVLAAALIPVDVSDLFGVSGRKWLDALELTAEDRVAVESHLAIMRAVDIQIEIVDAQVAGRAYEDPRARLLMTLPGVSVAVAETLLAAIGDIDRFQAPEQLAAYLGLVPSVHQSAERCYHGPITRQGNGKARWMLIQAAQHVAAHPGPLGVFFRRILKKKNRNVAVVAAARKLACIAWHMLKRNEPYRYSLPEPTQNKLAKLRVMVTKQKRTTGTRKGQPRSANYGAGKSERRVPALPEVYQAEGLPRAQAPSELKRGERRALKEMGVADFARSIQEPGSRPRCKRASPQAVSNAASGSESASPQPQSTS